MTLSLQNFTTLMQNMAAAAQGAARQMLDLTVGSVMRANSRGERRCRAVASVAHRAGSADDASRHEHRSRLGQLDGGHDTDETAGCSGKRAGYILAGTRLQRALWFPSDVWFGPGTDPLCSLLSRIRRIRPGMRRKMDICFPRGIGSVTVPVSAQIAGSAGNVQAGTVTLIGTAIPGVDTVTNANAFETGEDAETDQAFRRDSRTFLAHGRRPRRLQSAMRYQTSSRVLPS